MKPVQGTSCRNSVAHPEVGTKSDENNKNRGGGERGRRGAEIDAKVLASCLYPRRKTTVSLPCARTLHLAGSHKFAPQTYVGHCGKARAEKNIRDATRMQRTQIMFSPKLLPENPHTTTYKINAKKDMEAKSSAFRRHAPKGVSTKLSMPIANFETKIESQQ